MASTAVKLCQFFFLIFFTITTEVSAYCRNFKQSRNYYTIAAENVQTISRGYVCERPNSSYPITPPVNALMCNATKECPTVSEGLVSNIGTNNLSLSRDDVLPLYDLIPKKTYFTPPSFLYSLSGNLTPVISCVEAHKANGSVNDTSTAGYYSYIPTLLCIEGTLSRCENGPVENGTPIQLCAVNALDLGAQGIIPNGVQKWVATDLGTAQNMTKNPALSTEGIPTQAGVSLKELGISDSESKSHRIISNEMLYSWATILTFAIWWM